MTTGVLGVAARQDPRQVTNTMKKTVNFSDALSGVAVPFANYLPGGAFITGVWVEVVIAFNGTTPTVTVGVSGGAANSIVQAGDVVWTAAAPAINIPRGLGRAITSPGAAPGVPTDVLPTATWNATGAPTTGQAVIVIEFEGGWLS
jgi:hypothetical protein